MAESNTTASSGRMGPRHDWLIMAGLLVVTFVAYRPVLRCKFINYDDNVYVTENRALRRGLTESGAHWALTAVVAANWQPVTLLSLLVDHQLFALKPWGYHLVNLLLHLANTVLLFHCLRLMTGAVWRSALVAGLFALHPLHVESVAWVSERKDVLSTLLALLALRTYLWHCARPGWGRMMGVAFLMLLSLLAKPMWVTFPFLLLLLDFWPLRRHERGLMWLRLGLEKLPLFALSALFCVITLFTQLGIADAPSESAQLPLWLRVGNALMAYMLYLRQLFIPIDLPPYYPHRGHDLPLWSAVAAAVLFAIVSLLSLRLRRRYPYAFVGWWWYVGMLVPVIGIVQVGEQGRADRYTYVALVGLLLVLTWCAADLLPQRRRLLWSSALALSVLLACAVLTWRQTTFWSDSFSLWKHALDVTSKNAMAHEKYADALLQTGNYPEVVAQCTQAIELKPSFFDAYQNRGYALLQMGHAEQALRDFETIIHHFENDVEDRIAPIVLAMAYNSRGDIYERQGQQEKAISDFDEAIKLKPDYAEPYYNRGRIYHKQGELQVAIRWYTYAIERKADFVPAYSNRGLAYKQANEIVRALRDFDRTVMLSPDEGTHYNNRGSVYQQLRRFDLAIEDYTKAIERNARSWEAYYNRGNCFQALGKYEEARRDQTQALAIKPR